MSRLLATIVFLVALCGSQAYAQSTGSAYPVGGSWRTVGTTSFPNNGQPLSKVNRPAICQGNYPSVDALIKCLKDDELNEHPSNWSASASARRVQFTFPTYTSGGEIYYRGLVAVGTTVPNPPTGTGYNSAGRSTWVPAANLQAGDRVYLWSYGGTNPNATIYVYSQRPSGGSVIDICANPGIGVLYGSTQCLPWIDARQGLFFGVAYNAGIPPDEEGLPVDPACLMPGGEQPHGFMPFMEGLEGKGENTVFKFGGKGYPNGYGGYPADCVYMLGRSREILSVNPNPGPGEPNFVYGDFNFDYGANAALLPLSRPEVLIGRMVAQGFNGGSPCIERSPFEILMRGWFSPRGGTIEQDMYFAGTSCIFYGTGYRMESLPAFDYIEVDVEVVQEPVLEVEPIPAFQEHLIEPGDKLVDKKPVKDLVAAAMTDIAAQAGIDITITAADLDMVQGMATRIVGGETIDQVLQDYFVPTNYNSANGYTGGFDDAWGKVDYLTGMASTWVVPPKAADAPLDKLFLTVCDYAEMEHGQSPYYNKMCAVYRGDVVADAVANGTKIWHFGKQITPPVVRLPPNSSIPGGTPGTVGGGGTGSNPEPPNPPGEGAPPPVGGVPGPGGFWEPRYPDGPQGVWDEFSSDLENTPIMQSLGAYEVDVGVSDGPFCFVMPRLMPGEVIDEQMCVDDWMMDLIATALLIMCCIGAVRIVLGG